MTDKPTYFEAIRQKAAQRWDQLEQDPDLAGPWHQLFKQVQSPRHILSELLQNADDAGATEASVCIENQVFIFEHNGEDFTEEHFASLCRFGYSNKRILHTIGFRGVGFKSTFSLGDQVELFTPSLSICFHRQRFTEPQWLALQIDTQGRTRIRVAISDQHRQREVEKNLEEWFKSPISLLFFKNIRSIRIGERKVHWRSLGPGPIPESEWMALNKKEKEKFLLIRSEAEAFPDNALKEIRHERMLSIEEDTAFPPCKIEIVLGAKGQLYSVLPTGVETELPFACNAPFMQDPARLKIKDPETSPTNRWLLKRAGKLAASAMLHWLDQGETSLLDRAWAYKLFPDVDRNKSSLEGTCGTIVEYAFGDAIEGKDFLLTEDGKLVPCNHSIIIPRPILDIWEPKQATALLDDEGRPPLCPHVELNDQKKLLRWGVINKIDKEELFSFLQQKHPPKPKTWGQLLNLWAYVQPEITSYRSSVKADGLMIVPVQGKDVLYAASEVVRLGEKKLLQSQSDWDFLAKYLIVLNQNWTRFLAEQRRVTLEQKVSSIKKAVEAAYAVLDKIGLNDTSGVNKVINQVAAEFFAQDRVSIQESVRLAQIAAKLKANVGSAFQYITRDKRRRSTDEGILFDSDGLLSYLLPKSRQATQILHQYYTDEFSSCSPEDWIQWISSGRAGLHTFMPLVRSSPSYKRPKLDEELKRRSFDGSLEPKYKNPSFYIEDWDFDSTYWEYWQDLGAEDPSIWGIITDRIFSQKEVFWSSKTSAQIKEAASNGWQRTVTRTGVAPSWVLRLRELPCLPDIRGFHRKPSDLLRRTPETESLIDVEPFIHSKLDHERSRPLLDLFGVRGTPTGPDRLLNCLRALAQAEKPPVHEVEKWYRRLDQMVNTCSTADFQKIKQAFREEKLILAQDSAWVTASTIFLSSDDEDVPEAAVIRPSVRELTLWSKIGVAERPTVDLVIKWLQVLPSGKVLSQEDARRVRGLLSRHPIRIWDECEHWINLAGEWTPVHDLLYTLTMQLLIPWSHLHQWVKQKTADLLHLPGEVTNNSPFSNLRPLSTQIEERWADNPLFSGQAVNKNWIQTLGTELCRIELDDEEETHRVRSLAKSLAKTTYLEISDGGLEIIPYIDGTPAGTPRRADVVWIYQDQSFYARPLPKAKLARLVPEEIGKAFNRPDIKAALDYSFERSAQDIQEYLKENFKLSSTGTAVDQDDRSDVEDTDGIENPTPTKDFEKNAGNPSTGDIQDGQPITGDGDTPQIRSPQTPKRTKPSIIENFAKAQGFHKNSKGQFFHANGSWIGRINGALFPWEYRNDKGDLVRYYWPKDHCLQREPLHLPAEIWHLIKRNPTTHALILSNGDGSPVEVTGDRLCAMHNENKITLYPAAYRLVAESDNLSET